MDSARAARAASSNTRLGWVGFGPISSTGSSRSSESATCGEEMIAGPIPDAVEVLRDLKGAGVPCYALTNMEVETYPRRLERFPFLRWFDGSVVSGFEGIAKPDTEIFELLLRRFDLTPSSTLLIDDSARNVRAAQRLGMQAVEFRSASELRRLLEEAGVLGGVG